MKNTLFLLFFLAGFQWVRSETYLIDFNDTADANGYVGGATAWNAYVDPGNVTGAVIHDSTGSSAKGYTLSYSGTMTNSGNGNANTFDNSSGGPSWVTNDGSLGNTAAAADYFFTSTGANTDFTVQFGNLNPGESVDLDLWMSRVSSSGSVGFYSYSLDGGSNFFGLNVLEKDGTASSSNGWDTNNTLDQIFKAEIDGNDAARYMNISGLTIGPSGTLQVKVDDNSTGNWAGLGAMQLTVIPEPSTFALVILTGAGLLIICRHRR